jgi:hypothetical protein
MNCVRGLVSVNFTRSSISGVVSGDKGMLLISGRGNVGSLIEGFNAAIFCLILSLDKV